VSIPVKTPFSNCHSDNLPQSFESLNSRSVAVVIDPIQSVKGKVVIDAFRLINPHTVISGREPRQTTSNIGHINKPSIQALIHGLNRHYYSIAVNYRKTELEQSMLMNLHKRNWTEGLKLRDFNVHKEDNEKAIKVSHLKFGTPSDAAEEAHCFCSPCSLFPRHTTSRCKKNQHSPQTS
jgi:26S proteasome regulatory subunit N11